MNTMPVIINASEHEQSLAFLLTDEVNWVMFIDTSILSWSFRLNGRARSELLRWLSWLALHDRLFFPAWVIHEYNQLIQRGDEALYPQKKHGKVAIQSLLEIEKYASLLIDDDALKGSEYKNRSHFIKELSDAVGKLRKAINQISQEDWVNRRVRLQELEKLIEGRVLQSDVYQIVAGIEIEAKARYAHRLPPGYRDDTKEENIYGDLIIWKEILAVCKEKQITRAVILTNDAKRDWLVKPQYVCIEGNRIVAGASREAKDVLLPNPGLVHEFQYNTGSSELSVITVDILTRILASPKLSHDRYVDFLHLAAAVRSDMDVTPTLEVIQWFSDNKKMMEAASATVCCWERTPDEVDMGKLKTWTAERCTHIDPEKVDWVTVFCDLFL